MPANSPVRVGSKKQRDGEKWTFFVPGPLPGMNELIAAAKVAYGRGRRRIAGGKYAAMKREWTSAVEAAARCAGVRATGPIHITLTWREKNRRRDPDNIAAGKKFILDGLVAADVIENDGWQQILSITDKFEVDKETPGVLVELAKEEE